MSVDRQSMQRVADIYNYFMGSLPNESISAELLDGLTLVLKDVALFYYGNVDTARRESLAALDGSFVEETRTLVSAQIH